MGTHQKPQFVLLAGVSIATVVVYVGSSLAPEPDTPKGLVETSRSRYAQVDSYIARLKRHEVFKGKQRPEEVVLLKFREKPWSVYAKWLGEEGRGREGVYVRGKHGNKVHVRLAAGDVLFMRAGTRMSLAVDGALLRAASTHAVTDLGIGPALDQLSAVVTALERGDRRLGELTVIGPEHRAEFSRLVRGVEHRLPAGTDSVVPSGGRRTYWFDPITELPTLITTHDEKDRQVEYYYYDRLQLSPRLDDDDFDPDVLWGASGSSKSRS